jgi:hypothetical protein
MLAPPSLPTLQRPVQQSASRAQMSPGWMQNDEASAHVPLAVLHKPEQHCALPEHVLPAVLHAVLSGVHIPLPPHVPLQQSAFCVHAWLSDVHWFAPHLPPEQTSEQQSVDATHIAFAGAHIPIADAHV